jgi:hypothetical protein
MSWHVEDVPLLIDFAAPTSLLREQNRPSTLPIVGNGPPGTFVLFPNGLRVSLPTDLERSIPFLIGPMPIRDILWNAIISHGIHHRGQLSLMCRLAGGQAPGLYGPNREEMAAMRAGASAS